MADHPLSGPFYTRAPDPKRCDVCKRGASFLRAMREGRCECSHIECPFRNRVTAQTANPYFKEQPE